MYFVYSTLLVFLVAHLMSIVAVGFFIHFSWQKFFGGVRIPDCLKHYEVEDICLTIDDGINISAWFMKSPVNHKGKAIVLVHGFNVSRMSLADEACLFLENGFHVLMYDQRSHGNSSFARCSFGRGESADFVEALRFLQNHPDVDNKQIMALGASSGAASIMYAIAQHDLSSDLRAAIFEGAFSRTQPIPMHFMKHRMNLPFFLRYWIYLFVLVPAWYIFSNGQSPWSAPVEIADKLDSVPTFMIWGVNDIVVPRCAMQELYNAINSPKDVWWIENGGHDLAIRHFPEQYQERVIQFINHYC